MLSQIVAHLLIFVDLTLPCGREEEGGGQKVDPATFLTIMQE